MPAQNLTKYNVVNATDQRRWSEYSQRARTISQSSTVCITNTLYMHTHKNDREITMVNFHTNAKALNINSE